MHDSIVGYEEDVEAVDVVFKKNQEQGLLIERNSSGSGILRAIIRDPRAVISIVNKKEVENNFD